MNVHPSVLEMWESYLNITENSAEKKERGYESWHFCSDKASADNLAALVLKGDKRGTASLAIFYEIDKEPLPKIGDHIVITDWEGIAKCIIEIRKVDIRPFKEVDASFAKVEGEGDKSLEYWRRVHIEYFTEELLAEGMEFSEEMLTVCETFEVVYS